MNIDVKKNQLELQPTKPNVIWDYKTALRTFNHGLQIPVNQKRVAE